MNARVEISYSEHPPAVQVGLRQFALFNWGRPFGPLTTEPRPRKREEWDGPFLPRIAFVIRLSDSLLDPPARPPDVGMLSTVPEIDPEDGEVVGERPADGFLLDDAETEQFQMALRLTTELMAQIAPYRSEWRFIETALDFLLRAYTTEGLEQLLWHVTAIEAVLGQKKEAGLTTLLLNRTSKILSATPNERRNFRKRFEKLYGFRSDLVL
jgi:hypothetical protein